jgi:hypothetical protein
MTRTSMVTVVLLNGGKSSARAAAIYESLSSMDDPKDGVQSITAQQK